MLNIAEIAMDMKTRIELIELYFSNKKSASATIRAYNTAHEIKRGTIHVSSVKRLVQRFHETGSVHNKHRSGRPSLEEARTPIVEANLNNVQAEHQFGATSTRAIAKESGISQTAVHRILRNKLHLYPYKLQTNQHLSCRDKQKRVEFANLILNSQIDLDTILWTDESYFNLSGQVYKHNSIIWAAEKPKVSYAVDMHAPKMIVWFGFSSKFKLTPFFFPATVTGENYSAMLKNHVIPELRRKRKLSITTFQQDGAPPHYSKIARECLSAAFPEDRLLTRFVSNGLLLVEYFKVTCLL